MWPSQHVPGSALQRLAIQHAWPAVSAGQIASVLLMLVGIAAIHNNSVILLACGLPFDRALPWHKMLAASSILHGVIHLAAFYAGGRAETMAYARDASHHIFKDISKAYGMEVTGAHYLRAQHNARLVHYTVGQVCQEGFRHLHRSYTSWCWAPARRATFGTDIRACISESCISTGRACRIQRVASTPKNGINFAGWALLASMVAMSAMAVPWVTHRCFALFYRTHILFALLTGGLALLHGFGAAAWSGYAPASVPGAIFWPD